MLCLSLCHPERQRSVLRAEFLKSRSEDLFQTQSKPLCLALSGIPADPSCVCATQLHTRGGGHAETNPGVQGYFL